MYDWVGMMEMFGVIEYVTVIAVELVSFICVTLRPIVPILVIVTFTLGGVAPLEHVVLQNQTFSIAKYSLNLLVLVVETDDNPISDAESLLLAHKTILLPITATPPIKIAEAITVLTPMCLFARNDMY